jgi:hypothetical protein
MNSPAESIEAIVERVRAEAGGDFAFVLTLRGRLVTGRAPKDMPSEGRVRLAQEARDLSGSHRVGLVSLPREALVPYGGAAPVDVFLGVALEQAVLCVAMASWADKARVPAAIAAGLSDLEPILSRPTKTRGLTPKPPAARARARGVDVEQKPAAPAPPTTPKSSPLSSPPHVATRKPPSPARRPTSAPSIHLGEAKLGRETLLAIDKDLMGATAPPPGRAGTSMPEIRVELHSIGRATELDLSEEAQRVQSLADAVRADPILAPAAPRATQPWVELPVATKRAIDAARVGRGAAPPRLTLKLEDVGDLLDGADDVDVKRAPAKEQPVEPAPTDRASARPPKPSLDVWREALEQELDRKDRGQ